ncbi:MAG: hypothetical protein AUG44_02310 [Actinobacteria bacterium 13_1_20CM_3_71_11]|nr:MAG: hypothetical protein AUG44_02310 [Actinobacteria bacterium 13_1_20CM_3_71_11]
MAVLAPDRADGTPGLLFGPARRPTGPAASDEDVVEALLARAAATSATASRINNWPMPESWHAYRAPATPGHRAK